jgi:hypothetical protein
MVVVTERNVYVLKTNGFSFKASKVLFKAPLGSVEATVGGSAFPGRYLLVGDQKVWLHFNRKIQNRARAIAAAASGGSAFQAPAAEPPAGESIAEVAEPAAAEPSPAPAPSSPTDQPAEPGQPSGGTPGTEPTPASEPPPGPAA